MAMQRCRPRSLPRRSRSPGWQRARSSTVLASWLPADPRGHVCVSRHQSKAASAGETGGLPPQYDSPLVLKLIETIKAMFRHCSKRPCIVIKP